MSKSIIAENTKKIIEERGLKQCAVARWAGYDDRQFSAMMNGYRPIKDTDVIAIAKTLGVTPNDLFGIQNELTRKTRKAQK